MAKNSKKSKIDRKKRVVNLLCIVGGSIASNKGLKFLNEQDFMAAPEDGSKNYKPLIASGGITLGSAAGSIFIPNEYLANVMAGMSAGSSLIAIEDIKEAAGIGSAPKGDVQKFLNLYADLSKGQNNGLKI